MKLKGKLLKVNFWDHASCPGGEVQFVECSVVGICYDESPDGLHLCTWFTAYGIDENADTVAILKSAVIDISELSEKKLKTFHKEFHLNGLRIPRSRSNP